MLSNIIRKATPLNLIAVNVWNKTSSTRNIINKARQIPINNFTYFSNRRYSQFGNTQQAINLMKQWSQFVVPVKVPGGSIRCDPYFADEKDIDNKYIDFIKNLEQHIERNKAAYKEFIDLLSIFKSNSVYLELITTGYHIYCREDMCGITRIHDQKMENDKVIKLINIVVDIKDALDNPTEQNMHSVCKTLFHELLHAKTGYDNFAKHQIYYDSRSKTWLDKHHNAFPEEKISLIPAFETEEKRRQVAKNAMRCLYLIKQKDPERFKIIDQIINEHMYEEADSVKSDRIKTVIQYLYSGYQEYDESILKKIMRDQKVDIEITPAEFSAIEKEVLDHINIAEAISYLSELSPREIMETDKNIYNTLFELSMVKEIS